MSRPNQLRETLSAFCLHSRRVGRNKTMVSVGDGAVAHLCSLFMTSKFCLLHTDLLCVCLFFLSHCANPSPVVHVFVECVSVSFFPSHCANPSPVAHVFGVCVCVCVCLGVCVCVCMCVCACKHIHGPLQALPGSYETDTTATAVNKSGTGQRTTHLSRGYGTDMIAEIDRPVVQVPLAPSSVARSVLQGWANAMPPLCWAVVEA